MPPRELATVARIASSWCCCGSSWCAYKWSDQGCDYISELVHGTDQSTILSIINVWSVRGGRSGAFFKRGPKMKQGGTGEGSWITFVTKWCFRRFSAVGRSDGFIWRQRLTKSLMSSEYLVSVAMKHRRWWESIELNCKWKESWLVAHSLTCFHRVSDGFLCWWLRRAAKNPWPVSGPEIQWRSRWWTHRGPKYHSGKRKVTSFDNARSSYRSNLMLTHRESVRISAHPLWAHVSHCAGERRGARFTRTKFPCNKKKIALWYEDNTILTGRSCTKEQGAPATPKSASLMLPSALHKIFSGWRTQHSWYSKMWRVVLTLISRCMMLLPWSSVRALRTAKLTIAASASEGRKPLFLKSRKDPASIYSMTIQMPVQNNQTCNRATEHWRQLFSPIRAGQ